MDEKAMKLEFTDEERARIRQALWAAHCLQVEHRRAYELFIDKEREAEPQACHCDLCLSKSVKEV